MLRGTLPDLTLGVGDNEIAQQLADAFGENFDYASVASGPSAVSTTFSGYAGVILSFNASQTAAADSTLDYQTFFFEDLQAKFQSEAGVNLDEELSNMTRSEEHTSELQSLMRISYAVFCLKKKKRK